MSDNDNMQQPAPPAPPQKIDKTDASLQLMKNRSPITRNRLILILFVAGTLVFVAIVIGFSTAGVHTKKQAAQATSHDFQAQPPTILTAPITSFLGNPSGSQSQPQAQPQQQPQSQIAPSPPQQTVGNNVPSYNTYAEQPAQPPAQQVQLANPNQKTALQTTPSSKGPIIAFHPLQLGGQQQQQPTQTPAQQRYNTAIRSPILYANAVPETPQKSQQNNNGTVTAPSGRNASAYAKQNQAAEKQKFLDSQKADYGAYLNNSYLRAAHPRHELLAGTVIPITMVTGINSDNPGTIIAQVNRNVYDTVTGTNVLISAGSRLIGQYDNSVAFGQNRVLVAWNRLIIPNGVSIELRGMPGTDQQGQSGFKDKVNYHLGSLIAGLTLATVFNVGQDIALSALSTAKFLQTIAQAANANGQQQQQAGNEIQSVAQQYSNKLINQQPTITIRPGYNGTVIVNKDIILPAYHYSGIYGGTP